MKKTAIVVPCFNEARRLKPDEFLTYVETFEAVDFLFVNDGSTDDTQQVLEGMCRRRPDRMTVKRLKKNGGKADAVRLGFLDAMAGKYARVGYWDADLSTPLTSINTLCGILDDPGVSIVMGARVKLLGRTIERKPLRHYTGRIFATLASMLLALPVYDTQCGAKIFTHNAELNTVFSKPFMVRWTFDVELLLRFQIFREMTGSAPIKDSVVEYPLKEWRHVGGSKIRPVDTVVVAGEMARLFFLMHAPVISKRYRGQFAKTPSPTTYPVP